MSEKVTSPTKMKKKEIEQELLTLGYSEEDLTDSVGKKLKLPALIEKLQDHRQGEEGLSVLSEVPDEGDVGVAVEHDAKGDEDETEDCARRETVTIEDEDDDLAIPPVPPKQSDPEWTQFVLGHFLSDEVDGKNPRVEGLRRVAGDLVGELIEEGCDLVAAPCEDNRFRACVKAWGVFLKSDGTTRTFEALADAHGDNCQEDYATYLVAMADTRAKGRVFRNALGLRRVVAAEEVSKTVALASDVQPGGAIHTGQISLIRMMSDRHAFNLVEIFDDLGVKHELDDNTADVNLKKVMYEDSLAIIKRMREMIEAKGEKE